MFTVSDLNSFIAELTDLSMRTRRDWDSRDYSLDRMQALMDRLGHPERRYASLHVAGSNGKGSVCALASAALLAQGYRVGLYTSPHLAGPLAGIHLDGQPASAKQLEAAWASLAPHAAELDGLTVFETVTALAFQLFAAQAVDVAVIETGLGGRLDATNVIQPSVSVITSIDLEHTHVLGGTLAAIAAEKGGIIKAGVPVVIAPQEPEAAAVLRRMAEHQDAPLTEVGVDLLVERLSLDQARQDIRITDTGPHDLHLGLLGAHQAVNAATAYAALQALSPTGFAVSQEAIAQGFALVGWPGRLEVVARDPLVLLDGAHTPGAARALAQALNDHFPQGPVVAVLGISEDKDPLELLEPVKNRLVGLYATQSSHPRALAPHKLSASVEAAGFPVAAAGPLIDVLAAAQVGAGQVNGLVLVFGSVFLAEQARTSLLNG